MLIAYFNLSRSARLRAQQIEFDIETWRREGGYDSPYLRLFNEFVELLKKILVDANLMSGITDSALEAIVRGERLTYARRDMKANRHKRPNIGEEHLDKWFIRIQIAILESDDVIDKESLLLQVEQLFEHYYQASGYSSENPLYREARYLIFRIAEILDKKSKMILLNSIQFLLLLLSSKLMQSPVYLIKTKMHSIDY